MSRHAPKFVEVKDTSATNGGGFATDSALILGRELVSHGDARHENLLYGFLVCSLNSHESS